MRSKLVILLALIVFGTTGYAQSFRKDKPMHIVMTCYEKVVNDKYFINVPMDFNNMLPNSPLSKVTVSKIKSISLVYTKFKESKSFDQKRLNNERMKYLLKAIPGLKENKDIKWIWIEQTGCNSPGACKDYFHGFVINLKSAFTIKQEISFFNGDKSFDYSSSFHDGSVTPKVVSSYLTRNKSGYVINTGSSSFVSTPTCYDSFLYVSGGFTSRSFYAFNTNTGKLIWAVDLSDDGPSSSVVIDSLLMFNTESCTIFVLNRFTGKQVWSKWIGDPLLTHPVTDGKFVYTSYPGMTALTDNNQTSLFKHLKPSHAFVAMNAKTGKVEWQRWLDGDVMTTPVINGNEIYFTTFAGTLYKLSKQDGKIINASNLYLTSLPTITQNNIYSTQRKVVDGQVYESIVEIDKNELKVLRTLSINKAPYLDANVQNKTKLKKTGKTNDASNGFATVPDASGWKKASKLIGLSNVSSLQNFMGSTVVVDNSKLYACSGDIIQCIDIPTAKQLWSYKVTGDMMTEGGHLSTIPMVANNYIVTATLIGDLLLLNKLTGKLEKSFSTKTEVRNQPIVVKGKIFVPATDGRLTCIDTKDKSITGWTMFMKNNSHNSGI